MNARVLVVGLGNTLAGDDGIGPRVVERLRRLGLPPGLRAEHAGCDSLALPQLWRGEAQVWLVDAVLGGGRPGSWQVLPHEQVLALPQRHATVHHLSLPENLRWIALAYPEMAAVRYELWGIEPGRLQLGEQLTPAVAAAVPAVAAAMLAAFAADVEPVG